MCVAVPGKIIEINDNTAMVDICKNNVNVDITLLSANVGDYILIHAGCGIEVMKQDAALELIALFSEIEDAYCECEVDK